MDVKRFGAVICVLGVGCAAPAPPLPRTAVVSTVGARPLLAPDARFTVVEFFSAHCPCQAAHDARMRALAEKYSGRGVAFVAVDSEVDATLERDRREAARRHYSFPLVVDPKGHIARAFDAQFATYVVLVDARGNSLFRGGIDSDHSDLHADATPYLAQAIDDALTGQVPHRAEARVLGCALRFE